MDFKIKTISGVRFSAISEICDIFVDIWNWNPRINDQAFIGLHYGSSQTLKLFFFFENWIRIWKIKMKFELQIKQRRRVNILLPSGGK